MDTTSPSRLEKVRPGDRIVVTVRTVEPLDAGHRILLDCTIEDTCHPGPVAPILAAAASAPEDAMTPGADRRHAVGTAQLVQKAQGLVPLRTAVVHPVDGVSLEGAIAAARAGLIVPVLVGPEKRIRAAAGEAGIDLSPYTLVPTAHSDEAAAKAVAMAKAGEVEALMKGALHTDELLHAVIDAKTGLRTKRRISHVFVIDVPGHDRPLFLTDAAIHVHPSLEEKRDIVQNAIDLALALGIVEPKVALLSAVETVSSAIPSSIDAAALCKMADRGQITGGILDGPLGFDNAVSIASAHTKGIVSLVAGMADILVVSDLEAGNMLAKQLEYLAGADIAGIALGARVPIILTSRSDGTPSRVRSCAIALLFARHREASRPFEANS